MNDGIRKERELEAAASVLHFIASSGRPVSVDEIEENLLLAEGEVGLALRKLCNHSFVAPDENGKYQKVVQADKPFSFRDAHTAVQKAVWNTLPLLQGVKIGVEDLDMDHLQGSQLDVYLDQGIETPRGTAGGLIAMLHFTNGAWVLQEQWLADFPEHDMRNFMETDIYDQLVAAATRKYPNGVKEA
jgi:hypothetical protein